jgi:F-type H+-transporting ATPase subunit a
VNTSFTTCSICRTSTQKAIVDFSVVNIRLHHCVVVGRHWLVDSCGSGARKATSGVPGRFQAAVEILVEMVDNQAKANIHNANSRKFIAPLALTVFVWIFMMNAMDMLPVDLLPASGKIYAPLGHDPHHAYLRVVPTADLSTTLGLAVSHSDAALLYYSVKIKGAGGWAHELVTRPSAPARILSSP